MSIRGVILPGAEFISSLGRQGAISREAKKRLKKNSVVCFITVLIIISGIFTNESCEQVKLSKLRFEISFPSSVHSEAITGRVFVMVSRNDRREPRLQAGSWSRSVPFFGVDVENLKPGEVAQYLKEHYDLRYYIEENWPWLGPKLVGKIHLLCEDMDNFYLNEAVYELENFLEKTKNPYYAGSFQYGRPRKGHGWSPYGRNTGEFEKAIAEHITKNAPKGEDTKQWKYK